MKIIIKQDETIEETEITIHCKKLDTELEVIVSSISLIDNTIAGKSEGETFFIPLKDIYYFEAVDSKTFFYTETKMYESPMRLYQLEEKLHSTSFSRISKSVIANLKKLKSIKSGENGRLCGMFISGEKLMVSRQYVLEIKNKLGVL